MKLKAKLATTYSFEKDKSHIFRAEVVTWSHAAEILLHLHRRCKTKTTDAIDN
jgi:hypothetical protein